MGLKNDIKAAFLKPIGEVDSTQNKKLDELANNLSTAIIDFLVKQTFTITQFKAPLEIEELKTSEDLGVDVKPNTLVGPYGPVISAVKPVTGIDLEAPIKTAAKQVASKGATLQKLKLSKSGGQGGRLSATGYAYIGHNPVPGAPTSEDTTKVQLLEDNIVEK